jgi:hypothetical protein
MANNFNALSSFWNTNFVEPYSLLYELLFRPDSFQKKFEQLSQSYQNKCIRSLSTPCLVVGLVSVLVGSITAPFLGLSNNTFIAVLIAFFISFFTITRYSNLFDQLKSIKALIALQISLPMTAGWFFTDILQLPLSMYLTSGVMIGISLGLLISINRRSDNTALFILPVQLIMAVVFGRSGNLVYFCLALFSSCFITYLRPFSWLRTAASIRRANRRSLAQPERSVEFLKASRLAKDEFGVLPYPKLSALLKRAALYDWRGTRNYLAWLIDERPYQADLARRILIEHIAADLVVRKNVLDLAGAKDRLQHLLLDAKIIKESVLENVFYKLEMVAGLAGEYCQGFGVASQPGELVVMQNTLREQEEKLNMRRKLPTYKATLGVIKVWRGVIENELVRARSRVWQTP